MNSTAERLLTVEGTSRLRFEPDRMVVNCALSVFDQSYRSVNAELQRLIGLLRQEVEQLGFKPTDLKTRSFEVRREHEVDGRGRLIGFRAVTSLELHLPMDKELLTQVVEACLRSGAHPHVEVGFSVSEPEMVRARVLAAAVENARRRAETMAQAAGVKLGPIVEVKAAAPGDSSGPQASEAASVPVPLVQLGEFTAQDKVMVTWQIL